MSDQREVAGASDRQRPTTLENSRRVEAIAKSHHGVVSRRQLVEAGFSPGFVQKRIASLRLTAIFPGVYSVGHPVRTLRARHAAAVQAGGPCAALSHRSAGAHWGFLSAPRRIEILRSSSPDHPNSKLDGGPQGDWDRLTIHRSRVFNEDEYVFHNGIRTTTVERTLLDLAAVLTFRKLESALTEAERLGLVRMKELRRMVSRGRGWTGVRKLRRLVETWDPAVLTTRSDVELAFTRLCRDEGIEMPELNVRIGNMEVDCLWREQGLVVEIDTPRFHSSPTAFLRDRRKDRELERLGLRVLRLTDRMILDEPSETADDVRSKLRQARSP